MSALARLALLLQLLAVQYTYRVGAVPTAVDSETEVTRELNTAAVARPTGAWAASIKEIRPALGINVDTSADDYVFVASLTGKCVEGARQEWPITGFGTQTATIASVATGQYVAPQEVDVTLTQQGDVGFFWTQHGDTVALGFAALGVSAL